MKISGYCFLFLGVITIGYQYLSSQYQQAQENNKIEMTLQKEVGYVTEDIDTYDAILSIPQIHLKKGIYQKEDQRNNISKNVTIHPNSTYPTEESSNVILMAHSGSGKLAFFNDLDQLNTDSLIEFYYQNTKYVYQIDHYYQIIKNGYATIDRDFHKKTITLITCSQKDKTKQFVYIGYLIDEIHYLE